MASGPCPNCAQTVDLSARACPFCGKPLAGPENAPPAAPAGRWPTAASVAAVLDFAAILFVLGSIVSLFLLVDPYGGPGSLVGHGLAPVLSMAEKLLIALVLHVLGRILRSVEAIEAALTNSSTSTRS